MDDFLHNLRSGKLKQPERGRRDYADYKGPQRRAGNERRRTDYYAKVTGENFGLVKEALENLAEQQDRIANALAARSGTESRIADALESIATMIGRHLGIEVTLPVSRHSADNGPVASAESDSALNARRGGKANRRNTGKGPDTEEHPDLKKTIAAMRDNGHSWEKIARHLIEEGIPTVSGKGVWRGPAVKKFWDTHADTFEA